MAGALSLQQDIEALVEKHRDVALPVDLLSRLAEDARLMAVKENIRSIHEADPFGLFAEESEIIEESDEEQARKNGSGRSTPPGTSAAFRKASSGTNLPDFVERMLSMMKVTKHDKVTALDGFTTIDAELEFSLPLHERNGRMPHKAAGTQLPSTSTSTSRSSKTPTATATATGKRDTMGEKKAKKAKSKGKAGAAAAAAAVEEQKGVNEAPRNAETDSAERLPVHLHFSFVREPLGPNSVESMSSGSDTDDSHEVSSDDDDDDDDDDDSDAPNRSGVEIEMLDDLIVEDKARETGGASDKATEPKRKLSRDKAGGEAGGPAGTQKSKRSFSLKANARDATATAAAGDNVATQARVARRSNGNSNINCEGIGKRDQEKHQEKRQEQQEREGSARRGHLKRAHSEHVEATAESARGGDGKWKRSRVTDSRRGNEARARRRGEKGGKYDSDDDDDDDDGDNEGRVIDGRGDSDGDGDAMESILGGKGFLQTGSESGDEEPYEDGMPFEPLTLVSYTITGSIGFGKPEVLLQVTIYAKGDGPACFTLRKPRDDGDDDDDDDDDDEDEGDEEDAQDANVDEDALSAIGEALGIHVPSLTENDSGDEHEVPVLISGADGAAEAGAGPGGAGDTGVEGSRLMVEHLVWWLMMFPFFEKEFDIVGVVGSCIFDDDRYSDDEDDDDRYSNDGDDGFALNPIANSLFVHAAPFVFMDSEEQDQGDGDDDDDDDDDEAVERSGVTIEELD